MTRSLTGLVVDLIHITTCCWCRYSIAGFHHRHFLARRPLLCLYIVFTEAFDTVTDHNLLHKIAYLVMVWNILKLTQSFLESPRPADTCKLIPGIISSIVSGFRTFLKFGERAFSVIIIIITCFIRCWQNAAKYNHQVGLIYIKVPQAWNRLPTELKLMRSRNRTNLDNVMRHCSGCRRHTKTTVDLIWSL